MTASATPITKILIANRGEIACRVMRTAREMGIATVAVYSDADRNALHVRMADEAVHIGPSPAAESYLVIDKIIDAAKQTGADAVHPGYGFLSENPDFVRALDKAGITFIGPSAEAIEAMGLKDAAKALMAEAGVPVTPGYQGDNQDPKHLAKEAAKIGYPVLIKAVAGGGGKGMRKVERAEDFADALASCQREAQSSFGNDIVLIEKYITSPRHIEVQVFGDTHGNVVHMFERDCSLQRRHQKVIEEAPAPGMTEEVRTAMTSAAIKAAKAVNYVGAGTVEFIVDGSGPLRTDGFWFMEMNTRLQVEHPVTEEITGLDLVELQIRVAQGERLPKQNEITMTGHAIEARLYAEDPANDFLPKTGTLTKFRFYRLKHTNAAMRIDAGVEVGDAVSVNYDPMIAKIVCKAMDRDEAINGLSQALSNAAISGVMTNRNFLIKTLNINDFGNGLFSTSFLGDHLSKITENPLDPPNDVIAIAAIKLVDLANVKVQGKRHLAELSPFEDASAFRLNGRDGTTLLLNGPSGPIPVRLEPRKGGWLEPVKSGWKAIVDGQTYQYLYRNHTDDPNPDDRLVDITERFKTWSVEEENGTVTLRDKAAGREFSVSRYKAETGQSTSSSNAITAPMPGKVISVSVAPGDAVTEGQTLLVLEAMKMEMAMKAPRDGVVAEVSAEVGALVNDGDVLVALEDEA